uniref:Uncharacterized protein n=1 Tax=Tanacetum cinerariifolium TaxID=118510 RepID=A0A699I5L5_TANCI|nr:hypothetical protein [Tanacetum cinerariifolium]
MGLLDFVKSADPLSMAGKSPSALRRLSRHNEQADTSSGSVAPAREDATSSFVTPTPEYVLEDVSHDNVRTHPPSCRFVVLSSGSADPASPPFVSPVTSAPTVVNAPVVRPAGDSRRSSGTGPKPGAFSTTSSQGSSADDFYESQTIDFAFALNVYVTN